MISDYFSEADFTLPIPLTEEEIQQKQADFFANNKKINQANMALVVAKGTHKATTDPLKKLNAVLEQQIDDGYENRKVRAIEMVNDVTACMDYYEADNPDVLIYSRPLSHSERIQHKIKFGRPKERQEAF